MYDLLVATSAGVRLTPASGQPFSSGGLYSLQATSAETNVASVSSYLGLRVKVLTALVEGSPVADFIRRDFRSRGMEVEAVEVPQGGPWGHRHQINMADSGFGLRGPRVWNDRAGEVGLTLKASDFDLERIFGAEGVRMMHLSGLIAAMAPEFCLALASAAREHGTLVSFDLNYRASFWEGRADKLREAFRSIASAADILIGNEEDFQLCLGIEGPEPGGKDLTSRTDAFRDMIARVRESFPHASLIATTLRQVLDANTHLWGSIVSAPTCAPDYNGGTSPEPPRLYCSSTLSDNSPMHKCPHRRSPDGDFLTDRTAFDSGDGFYVIPPREIRVLDRIGGGDGFVGGLLYGLLRGWDVEKCAQFGWASGAMAATLPTDYATPADEAQLWSIWNGNARVKR